MVRKLYKHEISDLLKYIRFAWLGLLGVSIFASISLYNTMRLSYGVRSNSIINSEFAESLSSMFSRGSMGLFFLAVVTVFLLTYVIIVVNFYRSMLSNEGYLTHSLPFKTTQLFHCKLICGAIVTVADALAVGLAVFIAVLPTALAFGSISDIFEVIGEMFSDLFAEFGAAFGTVLLSELLLIAISSVLLGILYPVACMCLGQRFKNRILASVLIYIGVQWAVQFISSFFSIFLTVFLFNYDGTYLGFTDPRIGTVFTAAVILLIEVGACAVCYFISRHMLTKKLNLA